MRTRLLLLVPLVGFALACGPATEPEKVADATPEVADPLKEPRTPAELMPKVLATRDAMRAIMSRADVWYEDLEELQELVEQMIELLTELNEYVRTQEPEGFDVVGVARSAGDVEVALAPVINGIDFEEPAMWRKAGPRIDDAIGGLERRFPEGAIAESIRTRPDFATHYLGVATPK